MNILMFIDTLRGGGAENVTLNLAKSFVKLGHSVHIMIMRDLSIHEGELENIYVHSVQEGLDKIKGGALSRYLFSRKVFVRYKNLEKIYGKFHLKISHMPFPNLITKKAGIKNVVAVVHSNFSHAMHDLPIFRRKWKIWKFRRIYDGREVVCVSKGVADDLKTTLNLKQPPLVIYNPYLIDEIKSLSHVESEPVLERDYVIHVGRFNKHPKRQDVLVEAFSRIKDKVDVDLAFVGSGEYEESVKSLVSKNSLSGRVHFLGWKMNPYPLIRKAKVLVLCSEYEGFGGVLVESIVCGTIPVSTDCPFGPNEILIDKLKDFLTPVNDVERLADTIVRALESNIHLDASYYEKFSADQVAQKYLELADG